MDRFKIQQLNLPELVKNCVIHFKNSQFTREAFLNFLNINTTDMLHHWDAIALQKAIPLPQDVNIDLLNTYELDYVVENEEISVSLDTFKFLCKYTKRHDDFRLVKETEDVVNLYYKVKSALFKLHLLISVGRESRINRKMKKDKAILIKRCKRHSTNKVVRTPLTTTRPWYTRLSGLGTYMLNRL